MCRFMCTNLSTSRKAFDTEMDALAFGTENTDNMRDVFVTSVAMETDTAFYE